MPKHSLILVFVLCAVLFLFVQPATAEITFPKTFEGPANVSFDRTYYLGDGTVRASKSCAGDAYMIITLFADGTLDAVYKRRMDYDTLFDSKCNISSDYDSGVYKGTHAHGQFEVTIYSYLNISGTYDENSMAGQGGCRDYKDGLPTHSNYHITTEQIDFAWGPTIELTYPAGKSPKVFTEGWVFGARFILNGEDLSDKVEWSGTGAFSPQSGSKSYPRFSSAGTNKILLSVQVGGKEYRKEYEVEAIYPYGYAKLGDMIQIAIPIGPVGIPTVLVLPIITGSPNVTISGLPAVRQGDYNVYGYEVLGDGDPNVLIDGLRAMKTGEGNIVGPATVFSPSTATLKIPALEFAGTGPNITSNRRTNAETSENTQKSGSPSAHSISK